jgi:hypothetical protein
MSSGEGSGTPRPLAAIERGGRRITDALAAFWPRGWPGYVLIGLVALGLMLRLVVVTTWWPVTTTLADAYPYALYAETGPFDNPQHPAGYSVILAAIGLISHEVALTVAIQHLAGLASAFLLFAAVRRVSGSQWVGLLPAAAILLNPDLIYLEHSIMSEIWFVLAGSVAVYAAVRAFDRPDPWYGWPLVAGLAAALGTMVRTSGLFLIAVIVLALLLCRPRPWNWRAPLATAAVAAVALFGFASLNAAISGRFGLGPSPGWYLYGWVAQFADCNRFDVPAGAEFLCEDTPADQRPGTNYYLFDPTAPVPSELGDFGAEDDLLRTWAQRAILAQPRDYLGTVWEDLRAYYIPSSRPIREHAGGQLDPQLDYRSAVNPADLYYSEVQPATEKGMEYFFNEFSVDKSRFGFDFMRVWQYVTRFGGVALSLTTLLIALGLLIGPRRSRVGVLLFGGGGLSLLIAPILTGNYVGRYTVPMAGLMVAGAALAIAALIEGERARRQLDAAADPARN